MTYETIFSAINLTMVPAWLLLWFLPRAQITRTVVHSMAFPLAIGVFYSVTLAMSLFFGHGAGGADFTTAAGVSTLFSHPHGVVVGWSHYLVFDLFVGAWIGRDAMARGVAWWLRIPGQLFSFLFGPVGLLVYLIGRFATGKGGWLLDPE